MLKALQALTILFFVLGILLFAELLSGSCIFLRLPVTHSLAEGTGGNETDIIGGFSIIFLILSATTAFVLHKKTKKSWPKFIAMASLIFAVISFFVSWSDVI